MAHRVISVRCGIWSPSGQSGHRPKPRQSSSILTSQIFNRDAEVVEGARRPRGRFLERDPDENLETGARLLFLLTDLYPARDAAALRG
jgi:hypothetical protein